MNSAPVAGPLPRAAKRPVPIHFENWCDLAAHGVQVRSAL